LPGDAWRLNQGREAYRCPDRDWLAVAAFQRKRKQRCRIVPQAVGGCHMRASQKNQRHSHANNTNVSPPKLDIKILDLYQSIGGGLLSRVAASHGSGGSHAVTSINHVADPYRVGIECVIGACRNCRQQWTGRSCCLLPVCRLPAELRRKARCRAEAAPRRPRGSCRSSTPRNADESRWPS
jgi:hypothetical protein